MDNKIKLTTGRGLGSFIDRVIKETYSSAMYQRTLDEKDEQTATADKVSSDPKPVSGDDTAALEKGDVDVDAIVDKLNSIRSGKSFKDSAIKGSMEKYVDGLDAAEKTALLAFLKGIAQIVTGEIDPESAVEPEDKPAEVHMKKGTPKFHKVIKAQVVKKPQEPKKTPSSEDTSGPVPITPKKK